MNQFFIKNELNRFQFLLLFIVIFFLCFVTYLPHITNHKYPLHIDEWHHIEKSKELVNEDYIFNKPHALELGFHFFLSMIDRFFDLVLIYQYLPLIWAFFTSLIMFYVIFKLTKDYLISIFYILFYGLIGFDGLFFGFIIFNPLTFAIPFILLYFYYFIQGFIFKKKKYFMFSISIMIFLLFFHALSVLFSFPIFLIIIIFNYKYFLKEKFFFLLFFLIPIFGIIFYLMIMKNKLLNISVILNLFLFSKNWAQVDVNTLGFNYILSSIGYKFSLIGIFAVLFKKQKRYYPFIIILIYFIFVFLIFNFFNFSLFAPLQRNFMYFILFLILFSALGLKYILDLIPSFFEKENFLFISSKNITIFFQFLIVSLVFMYSYNSLIQEFSLNDFGNFDMNAIYESLKFLSNFDSYNFVISPITIVSDALKSISNQIPFSTSYFQRKEFKNITNIFYNLNSSCNIKKKIIFEHKITFAIFYNKTNCTDFNLIYNKSPYIYEVHSIWSEER